MAQTHKLDRLGKVIKAEHTFFGSVFFLSFYASHFNHSAKTHTNTATDAINPKELSLEEKTIIVSFVGSFCFVMCIYSLATIHLPGTSQFQTFEITSFPFSRIIETKQVRGGRRGIRARIICNAQP